jgi:hypothetical protein
MSSTCARDPLASGSVLFEIQLVSNFSNDKETSAELRSPKGFEKIKSADSSLRKIFTSVKESVPNSCEMGSSLELEKKFINIVSIKCPDVRKLVASQVLAQCFQQV